MRKFLSDIRFLLSRQDLLRFGALQAALVVNSLLELLSLAAVPIFIALLLGGGHGDGSRGVEWLVAFAGRWGVTTPSATLWFGGALVLALNLLRVLWMRGCIALQARMLNHRKVALASRLLEHYLRAPEAFHATHHTSDLMNRVVVECDHVLQVVVAPLLDFIQNGVVILCICVLLLCWMPAMTVVAISSLGLFGGGFLALHQHRMRRMGEQEQRARTQALSAANEALDGRLEAKLLGRRHFFATRFHRAMELVTDAQRANDVQLRVIWPYLEFVSLSVILLVTLTSLVVHHGDLGQVAPRIALLGMALVRLRTNAINLMHSWTLLRYHQVSLRLVCNDLRKFEEAVEEPWLSLAEEEAVPPCALEQAIEVQKVCFRHPGGAADALRDISLTIRRGESVGIVGTTGSGKSTLLKLLAGILQPDEGQVLVDGTSLTDAAHCAAWQHAIGFVPQQLFLMDDTLAANIALGAAAQELDRAALQRAIETAQLQEVVAGQPEGLETPLGEQGMRLSGGQRQRIAIARALYRAPKVLFWDEATSALDGETEARLAAALLARKREITLVMVTHRLSTVQHCDRIFLLEHGALVASGSYETLLRESPAFQELARANSCSK